MSLSKKLRNIASHLIFLLTAIYILQYFGVVRAFADSPPNPPGFRNAQIKIIADNDFAVFMGNDQEITRLFYQNDVSWYDQVAAIQTLDVYPLAGETYLYVVAMGGNGSYNEPDPSNPFLGGQEDWAGVINGKSIFTYPGAQVATSRKVLVPSKDIEYLGYLLIHKYFPNWDSSSNDIAWGPYTIDSATVNTAIKDVIWGSADLNQGSAVPMRQFLRTNCTVSCREIESGITPRGWDFPDASAVIFRYPLSQAQLPVTAGDKQVVVDWDAPAGGGTVDTYAVDYKESSEPDSAYKSFSVVDSATTIETVSGLTNGTSYTFRVTARNSAGSASSVSRAVTPTGTPSRPLNLSYAAGDGYVDVSFTEPDNNGGLAVTNYSYSTNNGDTWTVRSPVSTSSPIRISGLTNGTNYSVKIRAINPYGMGTASTTLIAKPGVTTNRTITYSPGTLDSVSGMPNGGTYLAGETFTVGAAPSRNGFTFTGWKEGSNSYQPNDLFTVGASNASLTAQWVQDSLLGTSSSERSRVLTWNIVGSESIDATVSGGANNSVRVEIPSNSFDPGTEVIFWRLLNDNFAKSKIDSSNSYFVNLAVSWSIGDDVTTPKTVELARSPIKLTITNDSIKAGATAWQIVGDVVKVIGTASQNGVLQLNFSADPVIAAANVASPPVFNTPVSTSDGFKVSITNYDEIYNWDTPTVSAGKVAITSTSGSNRLLTVTGLTAGQSATITQSNSLPGVANSSRTSTVTGSASSVAAAVSYTPTFRISYLPNSNDVTTNVSDYTAYTSGQIAKVTTQVPIRPGYNFINWNEKVDGNGKTYSAGDSLTVGSADITLYAQWKINSYTLDFNSNGGPALGLETLTKEYLTNLKTPTLPINIRLGYTFIGWNEKSDGSGKSYNAGDLYVVDSKDASLYAQWKINTYSISYDGNGNKRGKVPSTIRKDFGSTITIPAPLTNLTRRGFTFQNWNTAADGSGTSYKPGDIFKLGASDLKLYANWLGNSYRVIYYINSNEKIVRSFTAEGSITYAPAAPKKSGFIFKGWSASPYRDSIISFPYKPGVLRAISLFAVWEKK